MTRIRFLSMALLCLLDSTFWQCEGAASGFAYQGLYEEGGVPFNGNATIRFSLWDSPGTGTPATGGTQLGESQRFANLPISDGVFTVILNASGEFGENAFNGEDRWLQIEVCVDPNCTTLTVLSPRQPLFAAPYAMTAQTSPWSGLRDVPEGFSDGIDNDTPPVWEVNGGSAFYNDGNVGIGTSTPAKTLTVAGNMEIGLDHGYYQHLRIGGGNSSGFLYGSFIRYGDGIHLGYNYYADNAGVDQVIRPDGATSRITTGYGYLSLATGGVGQPPVDRVVVDPVGNVRLGPNTQYYAPAGDENLRILRGTINHDGTILHGSGFTVTRTTQGRYSIVFNNPFPSPPSITATPRFLGSGSIGQRLAYISAVAPTDAVILNVNLDGNGVDGIFDFVAVGPR